jgi:DNA-directed RNA polymerase II subunit RPB1
MKGVSENIMLGQLAKIGTGSFDLILNVEECKRAMPVPVLDVRFDTMMPSYIENSMLFNHSETIISGSSSAMTPWSGNETPQYNQGSLSWANSTYNVCMTPSTAAASFSPSAYSEASGFSPAWSPRGAQSPSSASPGYSLGSPSYTPHSGSQSPLYSPGYK